MTGAQIAGFTADQINALSPAQLASLNINYNSLLALLQTDANGGMNAAEFGALQALAGKLNTQGGITVSPYLQQMFDNVVLGNTTNATWTGGGSSSPLGNLTAASSQTQVNELIGKWFLGTDLPASTVTMSGKPSFPVVETAVSSPLYGVTGPAMSDVKQGYLGDCYFLAPLAEMAAQDPSAIQSMITPNGNNAYGVCFTVGGQADYITVDNELADGGSIFNHAPDDWASLIEKAYAQLQAGGALTGNNFNYGNSYSSIGNGGSPEFALEALTGAATVTDYSANGPNWQSYAFDGVSLGQPGDANAAKVLSSQSNLSSADLLSDTGVRYRRRRPSGPLLLY